MNGNAAPSLREERELERKLDREWEEELAAFLAADLPKREPLTLKSYIGRTVKGFLLSTDEALIISFTDGHELYMDISEGLFRVTMSNEGQEEEAGLKDQKEVRGTR